MKFFFCLMGLLCFLFSVGQEESNRVKPLSVGDSVPELVFTNVINHPVSKIHLSQLHGKLIVLDFWSSWCASCISLFPHLQELQNRFGDKIQIILVNTKSRLSKDDAPKIKKILGNVQSRIGVSIALPASYDNPLVDQLFPCTFLPHEVWIGADGIVKAITAADQLTEANIAAFIEGRSVVLQQKKDFADFDHEVPLFIKGNAGDGSATMYRSLLTGYLDGLGIGKGIRQKGDLLTGIYSFNASLFDLVKDAWAELGNYSLNRMRILSSNSFFNVVSNDPARYDHTYCYELLLPPTSEEHLKEVMRQDMKRYFNIEVHTERRMLECLVLSGVATVKINASTVEPDMDVEKQTIKKFIHNYPDSFIVDILNRYSNIPIVNDLKQPVNISIDLPPDLNDTIALTKAFSAIGLSLKKTTRILNVAIISDGSSLVEKQPRVP